MPLTARGVPYPRPIDQANVPRDLQALADWVDQHTADIDVVAALLDTVVDLAARVTQLEAGAPTAPAATYPGPGAFPGTNVYPIGA